MRLDFRINVRGVIAMLVVALLVQVAWHFVVGGPNPQPSSVGGLTSDKPAPGVEKISPRDVLDDPHLDDKDKGALQVDRSGAGRRPRDEDVAPDDLKKSKFGEIERERRELREELEKYVEAKIKERMEDLKRSTESRPQGRDDAEPDKENK
jgi:hypothetical protein